MKKYQYTSRLGTVVTLTYIGGLLRGVEMDSYDAEENTNAQAWFRLSEKVFLEECKVHGTKVTEVDFEITFDMFYNAYGKKVGKPEAEVAWSKLSKPEQYQAYGFISAYKAQVKFDRVNTLYPATYLNKKRWIN